MYDGGRGLIVIGNLCYLGDLKSRYIYFISFFYVL